MSAWDDLALAIPLLAKHSTSPGSPFHCEHDELWVMSDPEKYTPGELEKLDKLGFFVSEDGCFKSYRFGSA